MNLLYLEKQVIRIGLLYLSGSVVSDLVESENELLKVLLQCGKFYTDQYGYIRHSFSKQEYDDIMKG